MSIKELPELPVFPGRAPAFDYSTWRLRVEGLVARPLTLGYAQVRALPVVEDVSPFECVEGWRVVENRWRGVAVATLLDLACPLPEARFVALHAGDFAVSLTLEEARQPGVLLAYDLDGASLLPQHGAPLRLVVPARECYFGVKWVERLQLSRERLDTGRGIALGRIQSRTTSVARPLEGEGRSGGPEPKGRVVAVCLSPSGGVPKQPQDSILVGPQGVEGDYHSGPVNRHKKKGEPEPNRRQVTLLAQEVLDGLNARLAIRLKPGDLGENILVTGLGDLSELKAGDRLQLGSAVILEVSAQNRPCDSIRAYHPTLPEAIAGRRGVTAVVVVSGRVGPGDGCQVL